MKIQPNAFAFKLVLGLLCSLPTFGIDMILPSLPETGAALRASPSNIGLAMSAYLLGLGGALLIYGPVSDRIGRKPVLVFGSALLIAASIGCCFAQSFPQLLFFRALQGAGASGPGTAAVTIVGDVFEGAAARAIMSNLVMAVNIVPMMAPSVGAALLRVGTWRTIYLVPLAGGLVLLLVTRSLAETAKLESGASMRPSTVVRDYIRVLQNPICLGNILCNAAAAGAVFAYITGSSLFFVSAMGLSPSEYGLIFGASSLSVMGGTVVNNRLAKLGIPPGQLIMLGLACAMGFAVLLLLMVVAGGRSLFLVAIVMTGVALAFGLISPNAMAATMQPLPKIAGSAGAVLMFVQMLSAASSSALVAALFDGRSATSMAVVMAGFSIVATAAYAGIVRPAERLVPVA